MRARQNARRRNHCATARRKNRLCPFRRARRRIISRLRALLTNHAAKATSRVRLGTWSLRNTECRCFFTVCKLRQAFSAISLLLRPSHASCATSPLAPREPGESRQTENLWPAKCGAVAAEIFARNQKTWSRNTGRFDLSYLNCCSQIR